jgi:hypothetical protein
MRKLLVLGAVLVSACSTAQMAEVQKVSAAVEAGCADARPLLPLAGLIPVVGGYIAAGVDVACNTQAGLAKLAADPSSAEWLCQQVQMMKDALRKAGAVL